MEVTTTGAIHMMNKVVEALVIILIDHQWMAAAVVVDSSMDVVEVE